MNEKAERTARIGTELRGKWTLERLLGEGGMAAVYVGVHRIGRRDAIKILHQSVAGDPELRARFEQEALAVNRFHHPGAVEIRDIDVTDDGAPFLVMELLEGESLASRATRGPIPQADLLNYVDQILDVLKSAHAEGIVHRDIKPDNLFLLPDGRIKVLDFGIARVRDGSFGKQMATRAGIALGTMSYMPPEQLSGIGVDHRADLFAVGATMVRLLTGRRIHEARNNSELLVRMATVPAAPVREASPQLDPDLAAVLDRALMFAKERRYADAETMQADVRSLLAGERPLHTGEPAPTDNALPTMATPSPNAPTANTAATRKESVYSAPTAPGSPTTDGAPPTVTASGAGAAAGVGAATATAAALAGGASRPPAVGDATGVFANAMDDAAARDAGAGVSVPTSQGDGYAALAAIAPAPPTSVSPAPPAASPAAFPPTATGSAVALSTLPLGIPAPISRATAHDAATMSGLGMSEPSVVVPSVAPPIVIGATGGSPTSIASPASLAPTMVAGAPSPVISAVPAAPAKPPTAPAPSLSPLAQAPAYAPPLAGTEDTSSSKPDNAATGLVAVALFAGGALVLLVIVVGALLLFFFRSSSAPAPTGGTPTISGPTGTSTGLSTATPEPPSGTSTAVPTPAKTADKAPPESGPPGLSKKKKK